MLESCHTKTGRTLPQTRTTERAVCLHIFQNSKSTTTRSTLSVNRVFDVNFILAVLATKSQES